MDRREGVNPLQNFAFSGSTFSTAMFARGSITDQCGKMTKDD